MVEPGPIFLGGADRSGIGLLGEMLDAHPTIAVSRRTRFWTSYYRRYGDLDRPENLAALLDAMLSHTRVADLGPDRERLLAELSPRPGGGGYAALFALLQRHHLERAGKQRWGDKTLDAERHADAIFREFPTARMIQVIRDPRDRYASQAHHRSASRGGVGAGSALWRSSVRRGLRNTRRYRGRYRVVRYEDLVTRPVEVLDAVCRFVGEPFDDRMLQMPAAPRPAGGVDDDHPTGIVTSSIGRFRADLSPEELSFVQLATGRLMRATGYEPVAVPMATGRRVRFLVRDLPTNALLMVAWWVNAARRQRSGGRPPRRTAVPG